MISQDYKYKVINEVSYKRCSRCREFKPISEDYYKKGNDTKDGIVSHCKLCADKPKFEHKHFNEQGLLYCAKCELYKKESDYHSDKNKTNRNGKAFYCKICTNNSKKEFNQKVKGENLHRHLSKIVSNSKQRSKKDKLLRFDNELSVEFIHSLFIKQEGSCALSGLKMTYFINNGVSRFNVSIDRIDSTKGYSKNNIQLVCNVINTIKSVLTIDELYYFCKKIVYTYENKVI